MSNENELESLLTSLREGDVDTRGRAIHAIGQLGSPEGMPALRDVALSDPHAGHRHTALFWLGKHIGQARSLFNEAICHALKDPTTRWHAAWNLMLTGSPNPEVVEPLIQALADNPTDSELGMMLAALGKLRDARGVDTLVAYLQSPDAHKRGTAAQALGDLGNKRAIEPLTALLEDRATAWKEDYGPEMSVAAIAKDAIKNIKAGGGRRKK